MRSLSCLDAPPGPAILAVHAVPADLVPGNMSKTIRSGTEQRRERVESEALMVRESVVLVLDPLADPAVLGRGKRDMARGRLLEVARGIWTVG